MSEPKEPKDVIEDLDEPGEFERGHLKLTPTISVLDNIVNNRLAARKDLGKWIAEAEARFKMTPLEVLAVVSQVLAVRLNEEGAQERDAIAQLREGLGAEPVEPEPEPVEPDKPMCCKKHNMMGRDDGSDCKGGPVAGGTPKRRVTEESAYYDPQSGVTPYER